MRIKKLLFLIMIICVILDQIIKICIINNVSSSITVINNFFYITSVSNYGGAWSILYGKRLLIISLTLLACYMLYRYFVKDNNLTKSDIAVYGILFGGILGNLADRVFRGYVIDYLDFYIFGYDYPVFNLSDILIVISVFIIIFKMIRGDKSETRS